ncbi:MAG: hypothetical protein ACTTJI_08190 [Capnocytophaga sp.]|uniref:hypothetical protein n=1 Tax=Capnocytophaga sp. TaxID=44737 RepID=UPI003FA0CF40
MRKLTVLAAVAIGIAACNNSTSTPQNTETEITTLAEQMPSVGGDRDEHGCIGSAGQSWSQLLQECVQVFELGTRLDPVNTTESETVISAFVLFNADKTGAELFLANESESLLLNEDNTSLKNTSVFKSGKYLYNPKTQELSIDGKVTYRGEKPKI